MITVPPGLVAAIGQREGAAGAEWLDGLPVLLKRLLRQWGCDVVGEPTHGQVAIVLPVRWRQRPAVLKVSFPHPGNRTEASALEAYRGHGAVELYAADVDAVALLIERAGPGTLADVASADEAIEVAGGLARRLAVRPGPDVTALSDTAAGWEAELDQQLHAVPGVLPPEVVAQARRTIRSLAEDRTPTMLHGDLHEANVLRGEREPWLAIDPKGWSGTAAFDAFTVVAARREQLRGADDPERVIRGRIERYAGAAGVESGLATACCQARAVSSYLYQHQHVGDWFDREVLRRMAALQE